MMEHHGHGQQGAKPALAVGVVPAAAVLAVATGDVVAGRRDAAATTPPAVAASTSARERSAKEEERLLSLPSTMNATEAICVVWHAHWLTEEHTE